MTNDERRKFATLQRCNNALLAIAPRLIKQVGRFPVVREAIAQGIGNFPLRAQAEIYREWPEGTQFGNPEEWPEDLRVREMPTVGGAA